MVVAVVGLCAVLFEMLFDSSDYFEVVELLVVRRFRDFASASGWHFAFRKMLSSGSKRHGCLQLSLQFLFGHIIIVFSYYFRLQFDSDSFGHGGLYRCCSPDLLWFGFACLKFCIGTRVFEDCAVVGRASDRQSS